MNPAYVHMQIFQKAILGPLICWIFQAEFFLSLIHVLTISRFLPQVFYSGGRIVFLIGHDQCQILQFSAV